MGRQGHGKDPTVLHSSIALLQERFRRLEKVKEMREEREMLKVFATESGMRASTGPCSEQQQQPRWFFHPELVHPSRPLHGPKSVSSAENSNSEFRNPGTSFPTVLWPDRTTTGQAAMNYPNEKDVDTSLHL